MNMFIFVWRGPKFSLLAHTTLRLEHVQEGFKTHDLSLAAAGDLFSLCSFPLVSTPRYLIPRLLSSPEDDPFWLPLYGSMCCRLVAQPLCMIQPIISGQVKVKVFRFVRSCVFLLPLKSCITPSLNASLYSLLPFSGERTLIAGKMSTVSWGGRIFAASTVKESRSLSISHYS